MEYYIKRKYKSWFAFDGFMTKLEMIAFGWSYEGSEVEYLNSYNLSYDEASDKLTATQNSKHYEIFERISPYTFNPIFIFLELLMSVFSWIRRKLIYLLFGLIVIAIGLGLILKEQTLLTGGITLLAVCYVPSLILIALGFLMRIVFRMDKKLEEKLDEEIGNRKERNNNRY